MENFPTLKIEDVKNTIICGDALEEMKKMPSNFVQTIITDAPYEISFMSKSWDSKGIAFNLQVWKEALRVAKPGATLLCFGGTRTWHKLACAIENAGWIIKDTIMWVHGEGFPKATDIAKQIAKKQGAKKQGVKKKGTWNKNNTFPLKKEYQDYELTKDAKTWNGWKCISEDTEILTSDGFKGIEGIKTGDNVFSYDMDGKVLVNRVKGVFKYDYNGKLMNIKNRHTNQLITPNHRVICKRYNKPSKNRKRIFSFDKNWQYIEAQRLDSSQYQMPTAGL